MSPARDSLTFGHQACTCHQVGKQMAGVWVLVQLQVLGLWHVACGKGQKLSEVQTCIILLGGGLGLWPARIFYCAIDIV